MSMVVMGERHRGGETTKVWMTWWRDNKSLDDFDGRGDNNISFFTDPQY